MNELITQLKQNHRVTDNEAAHRNSKKNSNPMITFEFFLMVTKAIYELNAMNQEEVNEQIAKNRQKLLSQARGVTLNKDGSYEPDKKQKLQEQLEDLENYEVIFLEIQNEVESILELRDMEADGQLTGQEVDERIQEIQTLKEENPDIKEKMQQISVDVKLKKQELDLMIKNSEKNQGKYNRELFDQIIQHRKSLIFMQAKVYEQLNIGREEYEKAVKVYLSDRDSNTYKQY